LLRFWQCRQVRRVVNNDCLRGSVSSNHDTGLMALYNGSPISGVAIVMRIILMSCNHNLSVLWWMSFATQIILINHRKINNQINHHSSELMMYGSCNTLIMLWILWNNSFCYLNQGIDSFQGIDKKMYLGWICMCWLYWDQTHTYTIALNGYIVHGYVEICKNWYHTHKIRVSVDCFKFKCDGIGIGDLIGSVCFQELLDSYCFDALAIQIMDFDTIFSWSGNQFFWRFWLTKLTQGIR